MTDFRNIAHADWQQAYDSGMERALTFRMQSDIVILGGIGLFWQHSKNIAYLNSIKDYAQAYRGIRLQAVLSLIVAMTGAKFSKETDSFVKAGKMKALPAEFDKLKSWVDWADRERPEVAFDAAKDEKSIIKTLERKLDSAEKALGVLLAALPIDQDEETIDRTDYLNLSAHVEKTNVLLESARALYN